MKNKVIIFIALVICSCSFVEENNNSNPIQASNVSDPTYFCNICQLANDKTWSEVASNCAYCLDSVLIRRDKICFDCAVKKQKCMTCLKITKYSFIDSSGYDPLVSDKILHTYFLCQVCKPKAEVNPKVYKALRMCPNNCSRKLKTSREEICFSCAVITKRCMFCKQNIERKK